MPTNILFILVDGLRADQCFGVDKTSYTPFLDSLISNGVYFKNTFCTFQTFSEFQRSNISGRYGSKTRAAAQAQCWLVRGRRGESESSKSYPGSDR